MTYSNNPDMNAVIQRHKDRTCEAKNCSRPIDRCGRYCRKHRKALNRNGHPEVARVTAYELRPYMQMAAGFVDQQKRLQHAGVRAALQWIGVQLAVHHAADDAHRAQQPAKKWAAWLAKAVRDGVEPESILATCIGFALMQATDGERLPDLRTHQMQLGAAVLRLAGRNWTGAKGANTRAVPHSPALKLYAGHVLLHALGTLSVIAAKHLQDREVRDQCPVPREAATAPFVDGLEALEALRIQRAGCTEEFRNA